MARCAVTCVSIPDLQAVHRVQAQQTDAADAETVIPCLCENGNLRIIFPLCGSRNLRCGAPHVAILCSQGEQCIIFVLTSFQQQGRTGRSWTGVCCPCPASLVSGPVREFESGNPPTTGESVSTK